MTMVMEIKGKPFIEGVSGNILDKKDNPKHNNKNNKKEEMIR